MRWGGQFDRDRSFKPVDVSVERECSGQAQATCTSVGRANGQGTSGLVVAHPKRTPRVVSVFAAQPAVHGDVRVGAYALEIGGIKRIKRERLGTVDAPFTHEGVGGHDKQVAGRTVPVNGMG